MRTLSKFDVLYYLPQIESPRAEKLGRYLEMNISLKQVNERTILERIRTLVKDGFISKDLALQEGAANCLAFLGWSKLRGKDYNLFLQKNPVELFKTVFQRGRMESEDIIKATKLSRPTVQNAARFFSENSFLRIEKKNPLVIEANLNDLSFFYTNFLGLGYGNFSRKFKFPKLPEMRSKKLEDKLVQLHIYSTTVTEGNTALPEDVKRILENRPVKLTPLEIEEIINAKKAIEILYSFYREKITANRIKDLHKALTKNILDSAGEFYYGKKRVLGSESGFPSSKLEIDMAVAALLNFIEKNEGKINPLLLGAIAHFIFVSIHPFADGNGRVARLLHSWILLKAGCPIFVFDPNKRNKYFDAIEEGRKTDIGGFIKFCLEEHYKSVREIIGSR